MSSSRTATLLVVALALALAEGSTNKRLHEIAEEVNRATASWYADADSESSRIAVSRLAAVRPLESIRSLGASLQQATTRQVLPKFFNSFEEPRFSHCSDLMRYIRDQGHCGSCWALGSIQTMSDRLCLATGQLTLLSSADLAFCSGCGGCGGAQESCGFRYFSRVGIVSEECAPYESYIPGDWPDSEKSPECRPKCENSDEPWDENKTTSRSFRYVEGERRMMSEIYRNGPGSAAFRVYEDFKTFTGGVYHHVSGDYLGGHVVKLYGWGEQRVRGEVEKYWLVANSWGINWGDEGLFMMRRGINECGIEDGLIFPTF
eukprot:m51a1_g13152 putative cathepsin b-like cysteine protease (318) ;mRNA; r:21207-22261